MDKKTLWIIGIIGVIILLGIYFYAGNNVRTSEETIKIGSMLV